MNAVGGVTADELVRALKRRRATLPAEIGTFVALETCEAMLARGPCVVSLPTLRISDEGMVRIEEAAPCDQENAARALHAALTSLLVAAGPAPAPLLMRLVEEGPDGGEWALAPMRDELEASLVPLNRMASRRVLSRLVRETGWADRPSHGKGPSFRELDAELSSILGVQELAPAEAPSAARQPAAQQAAHERDLTVPDPVQEVDPSGELMYFDEVAHNLAPASAMTTSQPTLFDHEPAGAVSSRRALGGLRDLDSLDAGPPTKNSRGLLVGGGLVLLALALFGITLALRPDALARLSGDAPEIEADLLGQPQRAHESAVGGDLIVRVTPERAQVLRFVGRGPATVPHLPVGVAHEFVAILDGNKPSRALIPPSSAWENLPDGPRYELAMQLSELDTPSVRLELGETLLPKNVGSPTGALGSARIVTTPRGAKVYQLIGFAPEVRVEDLSLEATQELLVYLPGHAHVVRVLAPSDFVERDGRKVAEVDIALTPLKRR